MGNDSQFLQKLNEGIVLDPELNLYQSHREMKVVTSHITPKIFD